MKRHLTLITILVAAIIFVAVNMLGTKLFSPYRFDFTEHRIYTLSDGTRQVLKNLDEPVTVRFFFSEKDAVGYPVIQAYATRVKGILEQYVRAADGKLKFETVATESFSEEEDLAVAAGMQGVPINESGTKMFFGVAATGPTDETIAIPFLDSDRQVFLEYDLSRLIDDAAHPQKPVIGLLSGAPMSGGIGLMMNYQKPWILYEQMKEQFDLRILQSDMKEIPSGMKLLMVVHPHNISEPVLRLIDQFILKGGSAIFFLDPSFITEGDTSSDMKKLLNAWGVELVPGRVAADPESAMRVQINEGSESSMQAAMNVSWLNLTDDATINREDVSTAQLRMVRFIESGYFAVKKDAPVKVTTLLSTHNPGYSLKVETLKENKNNPVPLEAAAKKEKAALPLAIRIEGKVKSAFPDDGKGDYLAESKDNIHLVLVGDSDMLADNFWVAEQSFFGKRAYVPTADNGGFAMNLIDAMSGDPELIGLRSRGTEDRPFEVVGKMRQKAERKFYLEETRLKKKLVEIEANMRALGKENEEGALFSEAQQEQMKNFRQEMLHTRKQLRDVQRDLQQEIGTLSTTLQWINIGLMPLVVLLLSLWLPRKLGVRRARKGA